MLTCSALVCVLCVYCPQVEHAQAELTEAMTVGSITSPATLIRFNGLAAAIMVAQGQRDTAIRLAVEAAQLVWLGGMQPEQYSSAEGLTLTLDVLLGLVAEWAFDLRAASTSPTTLVPVCVCVPVSVSVCVGTAAP